MKRILNYPGSKWRLSDLIISQMPAHDAYLEPFMGSLAVFLNKPRVILETINDIDARLVNLFRVMRDDPEKLQYLIYHTLYSREEFIKSNEIAVDPVEDARRMAVRLWFGVGGKTFAMPGFRKNISWNGPYTAYEWTDMFNRIGYAASRLKDAQIECKDGIQLIKEHNDSDTLIYCDPPYLSSSLVSNHYANGFTKQQHEELLVSLLNHKGPVILSGYESDMYNDALKNWNKITQNTKVGITTEKKSDRTEVLWMNFEPNRQISLFG
ncbi:DNA adenine methylase [Enterococcus faecalis]|uniref:DNA adenine methylase n=1 Tax=Enterococcus faecalis TaxID=1351 RepID=UPI000A19B765|nr:DNA adenine methylase [Enterococcus faecalis]MCV6009987.1 DNA adenine methylase [Enterococcus faecalis]MDK4411299.1 DNA adenine methylase [Enterococcus faecalis]OSM18178.1 DNA methyltransferase [Enterococcus faecalis]OSM28332.1 DNA methyltransferase [Enterococcus faecalis]WPH46468.1 DNA adenine methylase [Enterococcus faecalis]